MEIWALFMLCFVSGCSFPDGKCLLIAVCAPLSTFCFCFSWLFVVSSVVLLRTWWGDFALSPAVTKGGDGSLQNAVTKGKLYFNTIFQCKCNNPS